MKSSQQSDRYLGSQNLCSGLWREPNQLPCLYLLCLIMYCGIGYQQQQQLGWQLVSNSILNLGDSARHLKNTIPLKRKCHLFSTQKKLVLKKVIGLCLAAQLSLLKTTWISTAPHCCPERTSSSDIYLEGEVLQKVWHIFKWLCNSILCFV